MQSALSLLMAFVAAGLCVQQGSSFVVSNPMILGISGRDPSRRMSAAAEVPTIEELSKDPFMKQVGHAQAVVNLLVSSSQDDTRQQQENDLVLLESLLTAQLSHSDGIRGFFVTYLTSSTSDDNDNDNDMAITKSVVPEVLQKAMARVDAKELVPLACMNVVMPTGMMTLHEDPKLAKSSRMTSQRGSCILKCLVDKSTPSAKENCVAILSVATNGKGPNSSHAKPELVAYWTDVFEKWGYKEEQKKDIAEAISNIL